MERAAAPDADRVEPRQHELRAVDVVAHRADGRLDVHAVRVVLLHQPLGLGDVLILRLPAARRLVHFLERQGEVPGELLHDAGRGEELAHDAAELHQDALMRRDNSGNRRGR